MLSVEWLANSIEKKGTQEFHVWRCFCVFILNRPSLSSLKLTILKSPVTCWTDCVSHKMFVLSSTPSHQKTIHWSIEIEVRLIFFRAPNNSFYIFPKRSQGNGISRYRFTVCRKNKNKLTVITFLRLVNTRVWSIARFTQLFHHMSTYINDCKRVKGSSNILCFYQAQHEKRCKG